MNCCCVIAFSRQNNWASKRRYKASDVTVNQCLIPLVGIFKQFNLKVKIFVDNLAELKVTRINFSSLYNSACQESYAFCEISLSIVFNIVHIRRFLALVYAVNLAIY